MNVSCWCVLVLLGGALVVGAQLPPEILVDQLLLRVERMIETEETEGALEVVQEILALQDEHAIQLPPEFHFRRAQVTFAAGTLEPARESVTTYLTAAGREGQFYAVALALLEDVDRILERRDAPDCAGQPEGTECWMELENQAACHVWNEGLEPEAVAEWTGECSSGLATGPGTLTWQWPPDNHQEISGSYRFGRKHGYVIERFEDGDIGEGPYVDGKRNGHWVWEYHDGGGAEGPNVDGKRNGHWVQEYANGNVAEGRYVDDRRDGHWVWKYPDGQVERGPYVDNKPHGDWVIESPDGGRLEGPYENGERNGPWVERFGNGNVAQGRYLDGQRQGDWVWRFASGQVEEGAYVDDERHGQWVVHPPDGDTFHVMFVRGVRQEP